MKAYYTWIDNLNTLFWTRVISSTTVDVKSLCAFRIVLGATLLTLYFPSFTWIAEVPKALFNPPIFSIANAFDELPGIVFFMTLDCMILLSLSCLTLGIKTRISTLIFAVLCIIGLSFNYSFGKIDHGYTLFYFTLLCMSFSGWGTQLALYPDKLTKYDSTIKSLSLLAVIIAFGMFTAGFSKALHWIDFDMTWNGFLRWYIDSYYGSGKKLYLASIVELLPPLVLEIFDYTAVLVELSPIFFLLHSGKAWRVWLMLICILHLAIVLFLNISFNLNFFAYLIFIDFSWLYNKLINISKLVLNTLLAFFSLYFLVRLYLIFSQQQMVTFFPGLRPKFDLYFDIIIWLVAIYLIINHLLVSKQNRLKEA
ncbi:hypothetical protein [Pontibacter ramchanderi]|uniref:HTTM domain-containing protein n=1 Tax=Pontibacter ramchanderi TaxID=1179743 RepID=A0A2N3V265_9BACT|nr:hypothetical protein [Pontibacter ramchanderi]PKV75721.1 hypothetical protein BD749_0667 [Pontibacter ramchanderi]